MKMKRRKMSKKGGERILSLYWFLLWVIAVGGLAIATLTFDSYIADSRQYEADLLANHLLQCITNNGQISPEVFADAFNLEKNCNLNLKQDGEYQYHVELNLFSLDSCNQGSCTTPMQKDGKTLTKELGDTSLKMFCKIQAKGKVPACYQKINYITLNNQPSFLGINIAIKK